MKNNLTIKMLLICVMLSTILFSCKKEIGAVGPIGATGVAGPAGSTVLSGNGAPLATIGTVGDFYLDLTSSNFYGPKKTNDWGTPFSMKGNTGAPGTNGAPGQPGSKILSGNGLPGVDVGSVGDYYLDKISYNMYGPKLAEGWGLGLNLKGEIGTANVLYSGWAYAKNPGDTTVDNSFMKKAHLAAPALTNIVLEEAIIQVYLDYGGGVFPLPYTSFAGGKVNTINYIPKLGRFIITRFALDNSNTISLSTLLRYRYVIIPGGVKVASANKIDVNNYEAVNEYFKLEN